MEAIVHLINEINGENKTEIIGSLEKTIAEDITNVVKEKAFFSLPLKNILTIISKTNLSEQEDPISLIKTIITQTIQAYPKRKKTLLLLHSLKTHDIELTLEQCADFLSLFKHCDIFTQLNKKLHENKQTVEADTDYLIKQKEKEIKEIKQEISRKTLKYSILNRETRN